MTLAKTLIGNIVPTQERGRDYGLITDTYSMSSVVGPLLDDFITSHASWRWVIYINLPFGATALLLVVLSLTRNAGGPARAIDYCGAMLNCAGTTVLLLLLNSSAANLASGHPMT